MAEIPIVLGDGQDFNIGRFKTGYDMDFQKIDSEWYIQKKPKIPDDPEIAKQPKRKKSHLYKQQPIPGENIWYLHSGSGRYFKESIEEDSDLSYFFLVDRGTYFEAFPVSEQHSFNPISKPRFNETEEQRKALVGSETIVVVVLMLK